MMPERLARYERMLSQLEQKARRRVLAQQSGIDFTSNDYLGLAESPRLNAAVAAALAAPADHACFAAIILNMKR
jgi:8-amino-7-oxononanoate synthase